MIILVLSACPVGLRGDLTKWLFEISSGVFVGTVNARVRVELWNRVCETSGTGRAILVWSTKNEQKLEFDVSGHPWVPVDLDGLKLIRRPPPKDLVLPSATLKPGWSKAGASRRAKRLRELG